MCCRFVKGALLKDFSPFWILACCWLGCLQDEKKRVIDPRTQWEWASEKTQFLQIDHNCEVWFGGGAANCQNIKIHLLLIRRVLILSNLKTLKLDIFLPLNTEKYESKSDKNFLFFRFSCLLFFSNLKKIFLFFYFPSIFPDKSISWRSRMGVAKKEQKKVNNWIKVDKWRSLTAIWRKTFFLFVII